MGLGFNQRGFRHRNRPLWDPVTLRYADSALWAGGTGWDYRTGTVPALVALHSSILSRTGMRAKSQMEISRVVKAAVC